LTVPPGVDAARAGGGTAHVHCFGGGRTGAVTGHWLVRHGLAEDDPIARIATLRAGLPGLHPSPETPAQIELVRSWGPG
jgi:protein-tyrosine phosphatase